MESNGSDELVNLKQRYPKQPPGVLKAYLKSKHKLEQRGLPVVTATGKKSNLTVAGYAFNQGLLEHLSGKEAAVYRTLLQGLPFQYRAREVIAEEAGVSISTVRQAMSKLEKMGLLARHRVPNSSCVLAFTDTTQLKPEQILSLKTEYEKQLIEKAKKEPVIKRELRTAPQFLVHKQRILKERKEDHQAPPGFSSFFGGEFAQVSHKNQSEAGHQQDPSPSGLTCDEDITPYDILQYAMATRTCTGNNQGLTGKDGLTGSNTCSCTCTGHNAGLPGKDELSFNTCTCTRENQGLSGKNEFNSDSCTCTGGNQGLTATCTGNHSESPVNEHGSTSTCTGHRDNPGLSGKDRLASNTCTGNHSAPHVKHELKPTCTGNRDITGLTGKDRLSSSNTCTGNHSASHVNEHGLKSTCTDNTGLTGLDSLANSLEAETGRSYQLPEMPVVNTSPFKCIPKIMFDQFRLCQKSEVFDLQVSIDNMIKNNVKPMDICKRLHRLGFLRDLREKVGRGSYYETQCNAVYNLLKPHIENGVAKHVLSQLSVLRDDTEAQIKTWIAHAKLNANKPNIGGLLISIILKAQQVDTSKLYPDAAGAFELFLDDLKIGVIAGDDYELSPEEQDQLEWHQNAPGDEIDTAAEKAGRNARRALLRDYTGVVQVLMEWERESDASYSSDDLLELLKVLYDEGDANGSPVDVDAPGSVKVSMVKLALHRMVDADLYREQRPVYLPHWIHEVKNQAKKAEYEAAA